MSKLGLQKGSVSRHMSSVIQPILEKGIVDHSILHRVLLEYFSIADKTTVTDIIQQLSSPLLVRVIGTKDGAKIGTLCVKYGNAKERKKIIKGLKGHVGKTAYHQYGCMVLVSILSVVDDTKLITKVIIRELQSILKELVFDKNGRRPLLQLLHPNCSRYFSPSELASMNASIPCLSLKVSFVPLFSVLLYLSNSLLTPFILIAVRISQKQPLRQKLPRFQLVTMIPRKT
jgi:pumilio family protein 6